MKTTSKMKRNSRMKTISKTVFKKVNLKNEDDLQRHLLIVKLKPILNYY